MYLYKEQKVNIYTESNTRWMCIYTNYKLQEERANLKDDSDWQDRTYSGKVFHTDIALGKKEF